MVFACLRKTSKDHITKTQNVGDLNKVVLLLKSLLSWLRLAVSLLCLLLLLCRNVSSLLPLSTVSSYFQLSFLLPGPNRLFPDTSGRNRVNVPVVLLLACRVSPVLTGADDEHQVHYVPPCWHMRHVHRCWSLHCPTSLPRGALPSGRLQGQYISRWACLVNGVMVNKDISYYYENGLFR